MEVRNSKSYGMSKKSWPISYDNLLYKQGLDFMDILCKLNGDDDKNKKAIEVNAKIFCRILIAFLVVLCDHYTLELVGCLQ